MPGQTHAPSQQTPQQDLVNPSQETGGSWLSSLGTGLSNLGTLGMQGLMGNSAVNDLLAGGGGGGPGAAFEMPEWLSGAGEWLGNKASEAGDWIGGKATDAANWAGGAWDSAKQMGSDALDWGSNKLGEAMDWGSDWASGIQQEGLGAVFDPTGAVDRQRAQEELADRFSVVPDDFVGPRLPNQVTQAEYERIAATYSDVRLGRGDLTIDPSALGTPEEQQAYRDGARGDIATMMQTESGRAMIYQLHDNAPQNDAAGDPLHRHTTMVPLLAADGTLDRTNGYAAPDGAGSTYTENADGTRTQGTGTDVHIRYNPGVNIGDAYPQLTQNGDNPWLGDFRSDVLLMHEMNHAMNQTAGTGDSRLVQAGDAAGNTEVARDAGSNIRRIEHQAAGLGMYANDPMTENRYRSERALIGASGAPGSVAGDSTMHQRTGYTPAAPSAPAPGTASPGLPSFVHTADDDHDHDHAH